MLTRCQRLEVSKPIATATLVLFATATGVAAPSEPVVVERQVAAMGSVLSLMIAASTRALALDASEAPVRAVEDSERRLSTWRSDTELAPLNPHPVGADFPLSPALAADLAAAARLWRFTGGGFDPGGGALVQTWDLRGRGTTPTRWQLHRARVATGLRNLRLDATTATRLHPNVRSDEGGFGKGAALDAAVAALAAAGASRPLLDFGGQLAVDGEGGEWEVSLAHPDEVSRSVATLRLLAGSLATSGNG